MKSLRLSLTAALVAAATFSMACSDDGSPLPGLNGSTHGTINVRLTDAPFSGDSVKSVDIWVVRVDARTADTDDNGANSNLDNANSDGWTTLASPNASYNLLDFQNGNSIQLGQASLTPGSYNGFRFIIDPSKSSITLKNGTKLTNTSNPNVTFPSASKSGIKIVLSNPVQIVAGATTTLLVDFDVNNSFVMRGNSIAQNGLLFKPVIKATVTDAATVNANVRLANATGTGLDLLRSGSVVSGASNIAFGASSTCSSVTAAAPALTIANTGTTTALPGFTPTFQAGNSYTILAWPGASATQFATLGNAFTPTTGQTGFRVFNATAGATGYDVFVTTSGAPLGTATVANALSGVGSSFVSIPAGSQQVRITANGSTTVLLDMGSQTFTAGQNVTLVIAPPASGQTAPRAFLVVGC